MLAAAGDSHRAAGQQSYMKSAMPFHGVTATQRRRLVRPLLAHRLDSAQAWRTQVLALWDGAGYREERYVALELARVSWAGNYRLGDPRGSLELYRYLVVTGAWWDLVDEIAGHLVAEVVAAEPAVGTTTMQRWAVDADQWVRRAAILSQLGSRSPDLELLETVLVPNLEGGSGSDDTGRQDFFIRKAVGWALRDAARRRPEWVLDFLDRHRGRLAGLSLREASKHL